MFTYVPNIGDARSLIVDPARITHREVSPEFRRMSGVDDNLIRLSIGLEDTADLIADLEQIISVLNRAGYVRSVRGAQGGYLLRKAPEEYTVGMILRLTEGSLAPVACLDEGDDVNCEKREDCVTLILWKKINDAICSVVDHITLQDLVDWQREKNGDYVI